MKRPSLADNIKAAATAAEVEPSSTPPTRRILVAGNDTPPKGKRAASRDNRKAVYAWVDPADHKELKRLSLDTGRTIDALVTEAVQLLFVHHGVKK